MVLAGFFSDTFGAGGYFCRGILQGVLTLCKFCANMLWFKDFLAQGMLMKFCDMSDTNIWGAIEMNGGTVKGYGLWGAALGIYNSVAIVGFGLFLVYWLINVIEKSNQDRLNGDEFYRLGLQLIIGSLLIMYSPILLYNMTYIGNWSIGLISENFKVSNKSQDPEGNSTGNIYMDSAMRWVGFNSKNINTNSVTVTTSFDNFENRFDDKEEAKKWQEKASRYAELNQKSMMGTITVEEAKECIKLYSEILKNVPKDPVGYITFVDIVDNKETWESENIGSAIGKMVMALLVIFVQALFMLITIILLVVIGATALSRSAQILLYLMFAPIAFADTFHQGFINSKSWRFIQKFLALCIQAGIIIAAIFIVPKIAETIGYSIMHPGESAIKFIEGANSEMGNNAEWNSVGGALSDVSSGLGSLGVSDFALPTSILTGILGIVIESIFSIIGYFTALGLAQKAGQISNDIVGV